MSVYDFDVAIEPTFLDFLGVGAGYGVLSVPVSDFLNGDVVNSATINITPVNGVGSTITKSVDMVQRTDGYFEWVTSSSISAHFTLEAADVNTIAAGDYEYSVSVTATRNGVAHAREVQGGNIQCRDSNAGVALIVSSIIVSPSTVTGDSGDTAQITAVAYDGNGNVIAGQVFDWTSSNPTVATVDATGLVSFLIPGDSTITAAAQGIQDTATATSTDPGYGGATNKQVAGYLTVGGWAPRSLDFTWIGGTATVAQGGTGKASVTAGSLLLGAGTSALTELAHGASGLAVISNGSTFTARAIVTADISDLTSAATGITKVGTVGVGTWQGSSIATTYTDAKLKTLAGTSSRITIGGTATDPTVDISAAYVGQTSITTLGTIATGVWQGTAIADAYLAALDAAKLTGTVASARLSGSYTGITAVGTLGSLAVTAGVTIGTTLGVTGATTLTNLTVTGTLTFSGTLAATTVNATNINATTISVTTLLISGSENVTGDFSVNLTKFTVAAASGNTAVAGTLAVTGASTVAAVTASGLITANSGLTVSSGTTSTQALSSTTGTFSGAVAVSSGGIAVTGASTITGTLGGITTLSATTVTATTLNGTLGTAAQPNITSVGTLTSLGVGAITSTGLIQTTLTSEQLRLRYDASNYLSVTVASNGAVTYTATGAGAAHSFTNTVTISTNATFYRGVTAAGATVNLLGITANNPNSITRTVAATDGGGFDWTNNGQSVQYMTLIGGTFNVGGNFNVTSAGAVTVGSGLTVSAGTSAFQATTATTVTATGIIKTTAAGGGSSAGVQVAAASVAGLAWDQTDASSNKRRWDFVAAGDGLQLRLIDDAATAATNVFVVTRTSYTASAWAFNSVPVSGITTLAIGGALTGATTGAFSGAIAIGNTVAVAAAIASTHKVTFVISGTTYYLLASNV